MTELKTLKDLKGFFLPYEQERHEDGVEREELRQEAIKWINVVKTDNNKNDEDSEEFAEEQLNKWIKLFFNITDEELKK